MFIEYDDMPLPKYLDDKGMELFVKALDTAKEKYKVIGLICLRCGLRITECLSLQYKHFNFKAKSILVKTLKQRKVNHKDAKKEKEVTRIVYMCDEIVRAISDYLSKNKNVVKDGDSYLFPPKNESSKPHITRIQVWRVFKKISDKVVHPHLLRHSFASQYYEQTKDVILVQKTLGHQNPLMTNRYVHLHAQRVKDTMLALNNKQTKFTILKERFFPTPPPSYVHVTPMISAKSNFHVGRRKEIEKIEELAMKKVNTLLIAPQGFGKSHLLDNITNKKVLRIDDTKEFKKTLAQLLMHIIDESDNEDLVKKKKGNVKRVEDLEWMDPEDVIMTQSSKEIALELLGIKRDVITRQSVKRLVEAMTTITSENEYTIIIDSADNITQSVIPALEKLREHFHMIVAAREIHVKFGSWLSNFQKIVLIELSREETMELIAKQSMDYRHRIENYEMFKTNIWNKTNGVPLYIIEHIERYRKEDFISNEVVSRIEHTSARKPIAFGQIFVILLILASGLRYASGELSAIDSSAYRLFSGVAMLFLLLIARPIFRRTKQKTI
jgi:integrase/recombinase XerD